MTWFILNLCRGNEIPNLNMIKKAFPALIKCLAEEENEETLVDCLWAFLYVCDGGYEYINSMEEHNLIQRIFEKMP